MIDQVLLRAASCESARDYTYHPRLSPYVEHPIFGVGDEIVMALGARRYYVLSDHVSIIFKASTVESLLKLSTVEFDVRTSLSTVEFYVLQGRDGARTRSNRSIYIWTANSCGVSVSYLAFFAS